jgi:Bacterial regulatory protein, arsR family
MAKTGPVTSEERLEILEALKRGNLSHREIARRFDRAQSTVSSIAKDAAITPQNRRKRTPAATAVEGTYSREERVALADKVLGVIGNLVEEGGLNPRDLKETTAALKQTLEARRMDDIEPEEEKEDNTVWQKEFAVPGESKGLGIGPNTALGKKFLEQSAKIDAGIDVWQEKATVEKAAREAARAAQEEEESDG